MPSICASYLLYRRIQHKVSPNWQIFLLKKQTSAKLIMHWEWIEVSPKILAQVSVIMRVSAHVKSKETVGQFVAAVWMWCCSWFTTYDEALCARRKMQEVAGMVRTLKGKERTPGKPLCRPSKSFPALMFQDYRMFCQEIDSAAIQGWLLRICAKSPGTIIEPFSYTKQCSCFLESFLFTSCYELNCASHPLHMSVPTPKTSKSECIWRNQISS